MNVITVLSRLPHQSTLITMKNQQKVCQEQQCSTATTTTTRTTNEENKTKKNHFGMKQVRFRCVDHLFVKNFRVFMGINSQSLGSSVDCRCPSQTQCSSPASTKASTDMHPSEIDNIMLNGRIWPKTKKTAYPKMVGLLLCFGRVMLATGLGPS